MKLLKNYLFITISQTFFPIFFTLFAITSIVYFVKIASLTSIIQINFLELMLLYLYSVADILFYTVPVSVFISFILSFSKLSSEYELMVLTSFGLNPLKFVKLIMPVLLLISFFLLIVSLAVFPKSDYLKNSFINQKKTEAQFNIKPSEYGQEFGEWLIYVKSEKKGLYEDMVLYRKNSQNQSFITAKKAYIENDGLALKLYLLDGSAVNLKSKMQQVDFEKMVIYNKIKQVANIKTLKDLVLYWQEISQNNAKKEDFIYYVLMSMFPLISVLMIVSLGYFNPRYDKNFATVYAVALAVVYIIAINKLSQGFGFELLYILPLLWIVVGYLIYLVKVRVYY